MAEKNIGWKKIIERGPDCLVVRLISAQTQDPANLADVIWRRMQQHFTYRVVIELGGLEVLPAELIEELTVLADRVEQQGGMLRLCGIPEKNREALRCCAESGKLPHYATRNEAIVGRRPAFLSEEKKKDEQWLEY